MHQYTLTELEALQKRWFEEGAYTASGVLSVTLIEIKRLRKALGEIIMMPVSVAHDTAEEEEVQAMRDVAALALSIGVEA